MIRIAIMAVLLAPAVVWAESPAGGSLAPYDIAPGDTLEWRTEVGIRQLTFFDKTTQYDGAGALELRWWITDGGYLGVRQVAWFTAPVAYVHGVDPEHIHSSGLDDVRVRAARITTWRAVILGLGLEARLSTASNGLSRDRVGGEATPVIATRLGESFVLSLTPSFVWRPTSPSGSEDEAQVRLRAGLEYGTSWVRAIASGEVDQAYSALASRTGRLSEGANLAVLSRIGLGLEFAVHHDRADLVKWAATGAVFFQIAR